MPPARFYRIANAKIKQKNEEQKFMDSLNAVQCAVIANAHRGKDTPPFKPETFRIFPDKKKATPEEIAAAMNKMVERQEQENHG